MLQAHDQGDDDELTSWTRTGRARDVRLLGRELDPRAARYSRSASGLEAGSFCWISDRDHHAT
jgi:hypothetical protein